MMLFTYLYMEGIFLVYAIIDQYKSWHPLMTSNCSWQPMLTFRFVFHFKEHITVQYTEGLGSTILD